MKYRSLLLAALVLSLTACTPASPTEPKQYEATVLSADRESLTVIPFSTEEEYTGEALTLPADGSLLSRGDHIQVIYGKDPAGKPLSLTRIGEVFAVTDSLPDGETTVIYDRDKDAIFSFVLPDAWSYEEEYRENGAVFVRISRKDETRITNPFEIILYSFPQDGTYRGVEHSPREEVSEVTLISGLSAQFSSRPNAKEPIKFMLETDLRFYETRQTDPPFSYLIIVSCPGVYWNDGYEDMVYAFLNSITLLK
ncbi:MAG: hypothetical protein PUB32_01000 [Clostridiales bacterium]|nr:hypothetical protein [Clostridiales bacterium]